LTFGGKVKGQGQKKNWLKKYFAHVKLPEKTIYDKIVTARAAVFDLRVIKGQGHFFAGSGRFSCKVARENELR